MKRRVLVVDDDSLTRDVLETILDLEEFDVTLASDATEAMNAVREMPPFDTIVADVMMPGMDGFDLTAWIKDNEDERTAQTPVILLTAKGEEADRARGKEAGCDAYLVKPFSPLQLIDTIRELKTAGSP